MNFSFDQLFSVVKSVPLLAILFVGVFTIAALVYNISEVKTSEEQKDTVFVLTILCSILILGMMVVVTQVL